MKIEKLTNGKWVIRCLVRGGIIEAHDDYASALAALIRMRGR
jgi:hypothetical protein